MSDITGNLLTSIRNAELASRSTLTVPNAKMSVAVLAILVKNGYVASYEVRTEGAKSFIDITLPTPLKRNHYRRLSTPGRRLYTPARAIPTVLRGLGMVIVSTSAGLMTGKEAKKKNLGGELICEVY
jgi:small subunit ribosomal protein S8